MTEKVLETIVSIFTKELLAESKTILSDLYDEGVQFIGNDLKKYLDKQKSKYSHIKTLLKGNTPVYLYEIYYPLILSHENNDCSTDSITTIFKDTNYVTIIGDAGSGKSTLSKPGSFQSNNKAQPLGSQSDKRRQAGCLISGRGAENGPAL